jgi:fibro-slime domain-containing protein
MPNCAFRIVGPSCLALLLLSGCSSKKLEVGEKCLLNTDCNSPLVCTIGTCHMGCRETRDCPAGQSCTMAGGVGVCQLPAESECSAMVACGPLWICASDLRCRANCSAAADCAGGQVCVQGFCADTKELDVTTGQLPQKQPLPDGGQPDSLSPDTATGLDMADSSPGDAAGPEADVGGTFDAPDSPITDTALEVGTAAIDLPRAVVCGDKQVVLPEQCDDGDTKADDGCSPACKIELGWRCSGSPSQCSPTVCGDNIIEGTEGCDDGNTMPFDGCSSDCRKELVCAGNSPCTSTCGDGIVLGEECDDGNTLDGDGCSSGCKVENGFECAQPPMGEMMVVPVVYRDFRFGAPPEFEAGISVAADASFAMVNGALDADGKPVHTGLTGSAVGPVSSATFAEWFRDSPGTNHANPSRLALWPSGDLYVNRYGTSGEAWTITTRATWCGSVGQELTDAKGSAIPCTSMYQQSASNPTGSPTDCQVEEAKGYTQVPGSCQVNGSSYSAQYLVASQDGNPLFFPVDGDAFTPAGELAGAQIPAPYDTSGTLPYDVDSGGKKRLHNFSFTSEIRFWFRYQIDNPARFDVLGDDDVWVFINKQLVIDLGGVHLPAGRTVTLDVATATNLRLTDGSVYEVAVFQAERQSAISTFRLALPGFNTAPSECRPTTPLSPG